jgi:hypothetical protein
MPNFVQRWAKVFSRVFKQYPKRRIFHMRKAMLLLAVLGFVGLLWAADPFVGTWKLNIA